MPSVPSPAASFQLPPCAVFLPTTHIDTCACNTCVCAHACACANRLPIGLECAVFPHWLRKCRYVADQPREEQEEAFSSTQLPVLVQWQPPGSTDVHASSASAKVAFLPLSSDHSDIQADLMSQGLCFLHPKVKAMQWV